MSDVDLSKLSESELKDLQNKVKKFRLEEKDIENIDPSGEVFFEGKRKPGINGEGEEVLNDASSSLRLPGWYWAKVGGE